MQKHLHGFHCEEHVLQHLCACTSVFAPEAMRVLFKLIESPNTEGFNAINQFTNRWQSRLLS